MTRSPPSTSFTCGASLPPILFRHFPYCLAKYLAEGAVKDRITTKINEGMFVTRLARTHGILEQGVERVLTMIPTPPFSNKLFGWARIIEDYGGGHVGIPNVDEVLVPEEPRRKVRQQKDHVREDPPVIPVEEEQPMDWYNVDMRRYRDDLGRSMNYHNESFVYLFE